MFPRREVEGLAEVLRHLSRACYAGERPTKSAITANADDAAPAEEEQETPASYDALRAEVSFCVFAGRRARQRRRTAAAMAAHHPFSITASMLPPPHPHTHKQNKPTAPRDGRRDRHRRAPGPRHAQAPLPALPGGGAGAIQRRRGSVRGDRRSNAPAPPALVLRAPGVCQGGRVFGRRAQQALHSSRSNRRRRRKARKRRRRRAAAAAANPERGRRR
jgi:hypothetical protein